MAFAHDTEVSLNGTAALVNTGRGGVEELPDGAALERELPDIGHYRGGALRCRRADGPTRNDPGAAVSSRRR